MTKAQKIVWMSVGLWVAIVPALLLAYSSGPDPRYTAAPGDSPLACASSGCHTANQQQGGPINAAGGSVKAVFSGGSTYTPGQDQTVTVTVSDPINRLFGFQMTARLESDLSNAQAGTFTAGAGNFVICDNGQTRGKACPANAPVEFIEHSSPSSGSFTFKWTPPAAGSGPVHFYFAGNAVNGNGTDDGGDHVYTSSVVLTPTFSCPAGAQKPSIAAVVSASAYGQFKTFAAGSWLEIYGTNLSSSNREWGGADFTGSQAPVSLDKVSVSINGKAAAVRFISTGQVNVQAPADTSTGPVAVTLTNCGGTSDAITITKQTVDPGMLAITVNNKSYLGAFTLGGALTGNPNSPAKPGDVIVAYGIGFGDTNPVVAPGTITAASPLPLLSGFSVKFGTSPDPSPIYAGLGPGFVGLYQFDLTVPKLADGDYQMTFQIGSTQVAQTLFFTVKN
jgi:uncharacterized protein (TIGR03437 family)